MNPKGVTVIEYQPRMLKDIDLVPKITENTNTRDSREASDEKYQTVLKNVYELLECPVCTTLMSPPIHQCLNGHTLCSNCKFKVQSCCPICRVDMGSIRCLPLEKLGELFKIYTKYDCPYPGFVCSVTGNIAQLLHHLKDDHNVDTHDGFNINHLYVRLLSHELQTATWMPRVFNCFGQQFCLHFEFFFLGMAPCYIAFVRFMGEQTEAEKYRYVLQIGGRDWTFIWQGIPRSIHDSHLKVRDNLDGFVIPHNIAMFFSEGNEQELKLRVNGKLRIETSNYTEIYENEPYLVVSVADHGSVGKSLSDKEKEARLLELPYSCPYGGPGCFVTGSVTGLLTHLNSGHNVHTHHIVNYFNHLYNITNPHEAENKIWILSVFRCFKRDLCLQFEAFRVGMATFYILFFWFMGDETEAKKFSYTLQFRKNGKTLTWCGVPRSIRDSRQKVREGLVIPRKLALSFSDSNEQELKLLVKGQIWRSLYE